MEYTKARPMWEASMVIMRLVESRRKKRLVGDALTISRRLGHGSLAITLKVYGHLLKPDDRAAAIMEATLSGSRTE
jgi:integrase